MLLSLNPIEARILGCLIEKAHTTPELYPLSLNSLQNACNQKSSRDPVMSLAEHEVARGIQGLREKGLIWQKNDPGSRVPKFGHNIEALLKGTPQEIGALCVLFLRGPQTSGEIRTRSERLCTYESVAETESVLQTLATRADGPYVVKQPRQPGYKEARWMHLFFGDSAETSEIAETVTSSTQPSAPVSPRPQPAAPSNESPRLKALEERITQLEARIALLESQLR